MHSLSFTVHSLPTGRDGTIVLPDGSQLEHASEAVREAAYRVYYSCGAQGGIEQEAALGALLAHRHRLAALAGFPSFADRTLRGMMPETRCKLYALLNFHLILGLSSLTFHLLLGTEGNMLCLSFSLTRTWLISPSTYRLAIRVHLSSLPVRVNSFE